MTQTETPFPSSDESSETPSSRNSPPERILTDTVEPAEHTLSFLEGPAIALVDVDIRDMSDAQLEAMLAELNTLCNQPGAQRRRMTEESTELRTKKPRVVKKRILDML